MPSVELQMHAFPGHLCELTFLVGFVLDDIQFSVQCFVDYILSICLFVPLYCLSFEIRLLITPFVSSKFFFVFYPLSIVLSVLNSDGFCVLTDVGQFVYAFLINAYNFRFTPLSALSILLSLVTQIDIIANNHGNTLEYIV